MIRTSVIIPTYNRIEDLKLTLPQVIEQLNDESELIIFDQSNEYTRLDIQQQLIPIFQKQKNISYYHCDVPSVPYAWNTAASIAKGDTLLFLDDDIDLPNNIIEQHNRYYENDSDIVGVAGGYYASSMENLWIPSQNQGLAITLAGVNTSLKKEVFRKGGCASDFVASFAGFDWELAEYVNQYIGKLVVGEKALVYHRAPINGGCGNQGYRGDNWYKNCYHNHILWVMFRSYPKKLTKIPRHLYTLLRYCVPEKKRLFSKDFFINAIVNGIKEGLSTYKNASKKRRATTLETQNYRLIYQQKKQDK